MLSSESPGGLLCAVQKKAVCSSLVSSDLKPLPADLGVLPIQLASDSATPKDAMVKKEVASAVKEEVADLIKNMQFSNMTSCTLHHLKM